MRDVTHNCETFQVGPILLDIANEMRLFRDVSLMRNRYSNDEDEEREEISPSLDEQIDAGKFFEDMNLNTFQIATALIAFAEGASLGEAMFRGFSLNNSCSNNKGK